MSKKVETRKSKSVGNSKQSSAKIPTIEEQFRDLPPSHELLSYYRNKLDYYEKEFSKMSDNVDKCKRACEGERETRSELQRSNDEVFTLQKTLSDMQTYLYNERTQVISLHGENDLLKLQLAKDREALGSMLKMFGATEDQVTELLKCDGTVDTTKIIQELDMKKGFNLPMVDVGDTVGMTEQEVMAMKIKTLEGHLKKLSSASQDEIHALHEDRKVLQMERESDFKKLKDTLSILTDRLCTANENVCEVTSDLLALKNQFMKNEENFIEQKPEAKDSNENFNKMQEEWEEGNKLHNDTILKMLKSHMKSRDWMTKFSDNKYASMIDEMYEEDDSHEVLRAQITKMNDQLSKLKEKSQKMLQQRNSEVEGLRQDVRMLRGRLLGLQKKMNQQNNPDDAQRRNESATLARETRIAAQNLEKDIKSLKDKMDKLNLDK